MEIIEVMRNVIFVLLIFISSSSGIAQGDLHNKVENEFQRVRIQSRMAGAELSLLHLRAKTDHQRSFPVLFIHGASFPSALAFGYRMHGYSWMDDLSAQGYDVFALDHLGYGASDRYAKMLKSDYSGNPLGRGKEVIQDIEKAIAYIFESTGAKKLHLIGHSWGATVSGHYSTLHPDQIDKLILFAPFVERQDDVTWKEPDYPYIELTPERRVAQFSTQLPKTHQSVLEEGIAENWGSAWLLSDTHAQQEGRSFVRYPAGWKLDLYDCWTGDCFFKPNEVTVSTLVIRGEWDTYFSWDDAEWLFEKLEQTKTKKFVVIEKSTHVAHLEKSRNQLYIEVQYFLSQETK